MVNFHLHVGNKVKCKGDKELGILFSVEPDSEDCSKDELRVQYWNKKHTWNRIWIKEPKECTPILRSLQDMADSEKRNYEKHFSYKAGDVISFKLFSDRSPVAVERYVDDEHSHVTINSVSTEEVLYLIAKGFDCHQFREGYYLLEKNL